MKPIIFNFRILAIVGLVSIFCASCNVLQQDPTSTAAPTQDVAALRTMVAQTIVADLTVQAALHPSPTTEPTQAPPTSVPTATAVTGIAETPAVVIKIATSAPAWVVYPTYTKTPYTDVCKVLSTEPEDYKVMSIGNSFGAIWKLKNDGMRDWNTSFYIQKVRGDLGSSGTFYLPRTVGVGGEYEFRMNMVAPNNTGTFVGTYKLVNDDGVAICQFFVAITVE